MLGVRANWYEDFFDGLALELWRRAIPPEHTLAEARFLAQELALPPHANVLDVPCGNGRHSLELAALGHHLTGVDISDEFIADARAAFEARGLVGEFVKGDMRRLPWPARFDGAFCFGNSFGYLGHADSCAFLAAVSRALKPEARFVLETGTAAEAILPKIEDRFTMQVGDLTMMVENSYDAPSSRLDTRYTFIRGSQREEKLSCQYVYTAAELQRLLAAAGLRTEAMYASIERDQFRLGAQRLLLAAVKS